MGPVLLQQCQEQQGVWYQHCTGRATGDTAHSRDTHSTGTAVPQHSVSSAQTQQTLHWTALAAPQNRASWLQEMLFLQDLASPQVGPKPTGQKSQASFVFQTETQHFLNKPCPLWDLAAAEQNSRFSSKVRRTTRGWATAASDPPKGFVAPASPCKRGSPAALRLLLPKLTA